MSKLLEDVRKARGVQREAEQPYAGAEKALTKALKRARRSHSWSELAEAAQLSAAAVRFRVNGRKGGS